MAIDTTFNQMKGVNGVNRVNNNTTTKPNSEDKKPVSKTVIGASLVGLAALASVGIYLATKGKGKGVNIKQDMVDELNNQATAEKLKELQKQANELKNKIGREYWNKLGLDKKFISGRSPLDRGAYKELAKDKKEMQKLLDENEPIAKEFSTRVRSSVKALQNDPEYAELRKLRHQYIKESNQGNHQNIFRLNLLNEVLYTKLNNGQKTPYFEKLGLSVDEVIKIIKDKSLHTGEVYNAVMKNIPNQNALVGLKNCTDHFNCLDLQSLFINGDKGMDALYNVKRARNYLDGKVAETTAQRIREARVNVAQEVRQSDDVKALKELNRQIAELSKG